MTTIGMAHSARRKAKNCSMLQALCAMLSALCKNEKEFRIYFWEFERMNQNTFEKILKIWHQSEQARTAKMSPAKTESCLSFAQFEAAEFTPEQQEHIHHCHYCARMNVLFEKYRSQRNEIPIPVFEKDAKVKQTMIWEKLKKKLNFLAKAMTKRLEPIPVLIRYAIPIAIAVIVLIFIFRSPGVKYSHLARIEPLYYQPLESRGEESLSASEKLFQQGMAFYQQEDYDSAITKLLLVIKKQPDDVNANFYIGLCYLLTKKPNRAISYLKKVIKLKGEFLYEQCYWYLGNAYLLKNDVKKAIEMFEKVVAMEGDFEWEAREMVEKISNK